MSDEAPPTALRAPLRALPVHTRPFPGESINSYLTRCALRNHTSYHTLQGLVKERRQRPDGARVAQLSGTPLKHLMFALPELGPLQNDPRAPTRPAGYQSRQRMACSACAAHHAAPGTHIRCWIRPHGIICVRHRRWLGSPSSTSPELDLDRCPDILTAHRHHLRLLRGHPPDLAQNALRLADRIIFEWRRRDLYDTNRTRRLAELGITATTFARTDTRIHAACYPDLIGLAAAVAAPGRSPLPTDGDLGPLFTAISHMVDAPRFLVEGTDDLVLWRIEARRVYAPEHSTLRWAYYRTRAGTSRPSTRNRHTTSRLQDSRA